MQLADVVEERDSLDSVERALVESGCFAEDERIRRDTPDVGAGFTIIGADRVEQRLERSGTQPLGQGALLVLPVEKAPCRDPDRDGFNAPHAQGVRKKHTCVDRQRSRTWH